MSTPNLSVSALTLAILHAFAAPAFAANDSTEAAEPQSPSMAEVVFTASKAPAAKRASVGGFSDAPLLQTPAAVTVIGQKELQDLQIRNLSDAVKLDASINDSYNAVGYAEQFTIRGFELDNNSSYRKDGVAIPGDTQIPLENKERIEVLKGLAGLQAGMAAPGGVIDFIVKRPTAAPLRTVTVEARERGTLYGAVDLGGRLEDRRFGYRINVAAERLRSYIQGADGNRKFISGAFDWQMSPQALLQFDADYQDKAQVTAPGFQLLSNGSLPANVSADTMLNKQPWTHPVETVTSNLGLRFQYSFNDEWHATLSANQHSFKRDDYTAYPYGCSPEGWNPVFCSNGDFSVWDYRSLGETKKPLSAQAMLQGKFATGSLRHEFTAGVSYFNRKDRAGLYVYDELGISNIYHPVVVAPSDGVTGPVRLVRNDKEKSVFVQDIVSLGQNWKLHGGLRHIDVDGYQYVLKAATEIRAKHDFLLPNVALVYNPQDNIASVCILLARHGTWRHGRPLCQQCQRGTDAEPLETARVRREGRCDAGLHGRGQPVPDPQGPGIQPVPRQQHEHLQLRARRPGPAPGPGTVGPGQGQCQPEPGRLAHGLEQPTVRHGQCGPGRQARAQRAGPEGGRARRLCRAASGRPERERQLGICGQEGL